MKNELSEISLRIKEKAKLAGFDFTGFSKVENLESEEEKLKQWLNSGFHGRMKYMENHFGKRLNPAELMPGARSVISLLYNYYPDKELSGSGYKIAKYAYGKDYHKVIKKKLKKFTSELEEIKPGIIYRYFVDSAPVMERIWAAKSGLGWIGKNTLLINKMKGSFFFIADILVDTELEYDQAIGDYCGSCTKCLDACPTSAFPEPYVLDASKCISYATIELKEGEIPSLFKGKMENYVFGCDICQDVCPWNRFSSPGTDESFKPNDLLKSASDRDWENMDEKSYNEMFKSSAVKRAGFNGLKRNIRFAEGD